MFKKALNLITRRGGREAVDQRGPTAPEGLGPAGPTDRMISVALAGPTGPIENVVPIGILGGGGQAGIPTIPAAAMPEGVVYPEPSNLGGLRFWRWQGDATKLRSSARAAAAGPYRGDPLDEPEIARLMSGTRTVLTAVFRSDPELLGVQHLERTWRAEVRTAVNDLTQARARHQTAIDAGANIRPDTTDIGEQRIFTTAAHARSAVRAAESNHTTATRSLERAEELAQVAGQRAIERLYLVASAGVERVDIFRTAFNQERTEEGRNGLGPLPNDLVETLVRGAIQPLMADAGPPAIGEQAG